MSKTRDFFGVFSPSTLLSSLMEKGKTHLESLVTTSNQLLFATSITITGDEWKSEHAYINVFYLLIFINLLAVFPSWIHGWMRAPTKRGGKGSHVSSTSKAADEQRLRTRVHSSLLYRTYLPAYLLATAADWLQGPYKYALYSSYGYTQRDIANLFVVGYGSGMILGSLVGGFVSLSIVSSFVIHVLICTNKNWNDCGDSRTPGYSFVQMIKHSLLLFAGRLSRQKEVMPCLLPVLHSERTDEALPTFLRSHVRKAVWWHCHQFAVQCV